MLKLITIGKKNLNFLVKTGDYNVNKSILSNTLNNEKN